MISEERGRLTEACFSFHFFVIGSQLIVILFHLYIKRTHKKRFVFYGLNNLSVVLTFIDRFDSWNESTRQNEQMLEQMEAERQSRLY